MCIGSNHSPSLFFNEKKIEAVESYKYLGALLSQHATIKGDLFSKDYDYLCTQAHKAMFALNKKVEFASPIPVQLMIKLFDSLIKPILTYGSDIWGIRESARLLIDTFQRKFLKFHLKVKGSTPDYMVYGESGVFPISNVILANVFACYHRLSNMPCIYLAKRVFESLSRISILGSHNWIQWVKSEAHKRQINLDMNIPNKKFKKMCIETLNRQFKKKWLDEINDTSASRSRLYRVIKGPFEMEPYLHVVTNEKHRSALSQFRCSSHHLAIETGRWRKPRPIPKQLRICRLCKVIEDEFHFIVQCAQYKKQRAELNNAIFQLLGEDFITFKQNFFDNVLTSRNKIIMRALAKFIFKAFQALNDLKS